MAVFTFLLLSLSAVAVSAEGPNPTLRIAHGLVQGTWKVSTKGRPFASFQGIPYARPPVGKYRFREPQQMKTWSGTWDATKPMAACLQYDPFVKRITGSENCLFINVYTPKLTPAANLPVLVFIHGGAFMYGEGGIYDPSHIMDRDMVVVTFNYRLGPLGFLSTGDETIPGNAGLKDQSSALHWVRHNIMLFGGNPDSITLTGCSAGGASVHYHYLSPLSRGTFHRGIAFSGSAFASWTHAVKPANKARALASLLGCPLTSNKDILECLKYRPAEALVDAQVDMMDWKVQMFTPFTPTAEKGAVREPFLRDYPYQVAMDGNMAPVPLITSVTSEEGLYPAAAYQAEPGLLAELEANWQQLASNIFEYNDTLPLPQRADVAAKIKAQYLNNKPVGQETFPQLVQALGDRLFGADVGRLAQLHARKSRQPVYVYRYSYRATSSLSRLMAHNEVNYESPKPLFVELAENVGVSHADDVFRIFKFPGLEASSTEDLAMTDALLDMLYSYATTGVPRLSNTAPEWKTVTPEDNNLTYLEISSPTKIELKASEDFGHRTFWDGLGFLENSNYHHQIRDEL